MLTLTEQCLGLPYDERMHLAHKLIDSLKIKPVFNVKYTNRAEELLCIMEDIMGEKLSFLSRKRDCNWAKVIIAYHMTTNEGFSTIETGRQMSLDHSTIIYNRNIMKNALGLKYAYRELIDIWKQFQDKLQNETYRRTDQDSL